MNLSMKSQSHLRLSVFVVAFLVIAASSKADVRGNPRPNPGQAALDRLQGEWELVATHAFGERFPDPPSKAMVLKIDGKRMIMIKREPFVPRGAPEGRDESTFEIDPAAKPANIDITNATGPRKGEASYAVYDLVGDTLKIAAHGFFSKDGAKGNPNNRPTSFDGKGPVMVMTFKRVKG